MLTNDQWCNNNIQDSHMKRLQIFISAYVYLDVMILQMCWVHELWIIISHCISFMYTVWPYDRDKILTIKIFFFVIVINKKIEISSCIWTVRQFVGKKIRNFGSISSTKIGMCNISTMVLYSNWKFLARKCQDELKCTFFPTKRCGLVFNESHHDLIKW